MSPFSININLADLLLGHFSVAPEYLGNNNRVTLEVLMALNTNIMVLWAVTSFSLVDRCQHFGGIIS
jgi:hypothetical protein